ncbi:unnamed protein product [Brassicogethes aeneus]|uniref:Cilia- and flagella-associated protein 251 n=1 Tax=Brassicogethes aeneus TaxID=1431903 RepID=A0A9P0AZT3_BRAAE|nr:unnamed protein product [Brassicogethes aeneus]
MTSDSYLQLDADDSERLKQLTAESRRVSGDQRYRFSIGMPFSEPASAYQSLEDINLLDAKTLGPEIFSNSSIVSKIKPFQIKQAYGINTDCNILNFSTKEKVQVFYTAAHLGVLYDYCKNEFSFFEGHHNKIVACCSDDSGNYLTTADAGEDACVIVWCVRDFKPIFTIFNIYPGFGCSTLRMSYDAKYLLTIGMDEDEEHYSLDLWFWTYGLQESHFTVKIKASYGKPKKICFHPTNQHHVMVVFEKQVFFCVIEDENKSIINFETPYITFRSTMGIFHSGTYIEKRHRCFVCSDKGYVLIFANTLYLRSYLEAELNNTKIYLKSIKVSKTPIVEAKALDNLVALGDIVGRIYLMDVTLTILYYYEKEELIGVRYFSFALIFGNTEREELKTIEVESPDASENSQSSETRRCEEALKEHPCPSDYTVQRKPVEYKPFFALTENCSLFLIEYFKENIKPIFPPVDSPVTSIEAHHELPFLLVGHENGKVKMLDYEKQVNVCEIILPKCEDHDADIEKPESIKVIKYSNESIHLVVSNNTGEIFVLDSILLTKLNKKPLRTSTGRIVKIVFNFDSTQFAYYDIENTVVIYQYKADKNEWVGLGKLVPHYHPINDILFIPEYEHSSLVTIGSDRYIVKYNNVGLNFGDSFDIMIRERIEQSAKPQCFVYYTKNVNDSFTGYYIIVDDQYKFKLVSNLTMMTRQTSLGPAFGAFKGHHITKLMLPEALEYKYYLFMVDKQIGLQKANLDGNPYSYVGYHVHPTPVTDMVLSHDGKYVFTFSTGYKIVFKWEIQTKAVDVVYLLGGKEFEPFYCLLEGGKNGWLFRELQDLFFYMQILHQGENVVLPRKFSDTIDISELPDLVRAGGYYPSEFEIENLIIEARYHSLDETSKVQTQISFFEFLKLYINHRPAHGYKLTELEETFNVFANMPEDAELDGSIYRDEYLEILTKYGEGISMDNLRKCFSTLRRVDLNVDDNVIFTNSFDFETFTSEILGIEMDREKVDDEDKDITDSLQSERSHSTLSD